MIWSRGGRDINRKHNALTLGSKQSWGSLGQVYKIVEKIIVAKKYCEMIYIGLEIEKKRIRRHLLWAML